MPSKINYLLGIFLSILVLISHKPVFAINNPNLLPEEKTPVIDLAKTLSPNQKKSLEEKLNNLEIESGWKIKYLSQFESSPGSAIKDYWDLDEIPDLSKLNLSEIKKKIIIFEQKMFYYKLNLIYENCSWYGTKACRKKDLISPQWLRNIKAKKYPSWRFDLLFSKKKYTDLFFVKNGGWHFTYLKTPEDLEKKLLNFAHHYEFEKSGLKINDIKKFMDEKRVVYDHNVDQKDYKWSGKSKLKKIQNSFLPSYISSNLDKYKSWLD